MNNELLISYLISSRKDDGSYKFSKSSESSLLSSSFGVMTDFLIRGKMGLRDSREDLIRYIADGIDLSKNRISDPLLSPQALVGNHKIDYLEGQITYFSLVALDVLGYHDSDINFSKIYFQDQNQLEKWFNSLDLSRFWYESNKIMFVLYFLFYKCYYGSEKSNVSKDSIYLLIELLNRAQDKNTGFWGTNLNGNNLYDGCFGTAHLLLFYDYLDIEIPFIKKIIDNTIRLHNSNGLMRRKNGGACEDYDAIEIYLRCLNQTDYRKSEISSIILKMRDVINNSQNSDGGFSYKIEESKINNLIKSRIFPQYYLYSGWKLMETATYKSDMWATWFRTLSIKVIDYLLEGETDFNSYWLPAWGYIKK
jgi:hypothetical protein